MHIRSGIIMSSSSGIIHSTSIAKPPQKLAAALTHAGCFWMRKPLTVSASYGARDGPQPRQTFTQWSIPSGNHGSSCASLWPDKMNMKRCSSVAKWYHEVESNRHRLWVFLFPVAWPLNGPMSLEIVKYRQRFGRYKPHINYYASRRLNLEIISRYSHSFPIYLFGTSACSQFFIQSPNGHPYLQ